MGKSSKAKDKSSSSSSKATKAEAPAADLSGSESSDGEFGAAFDFEAGAEPVKTSWDYGFAIPKAEREALERNRRAPVQKKEWGVGLKRKVRG